MLLFACLLRGTAPLIYIYTDDTQIGNALKHSAGHKTHVVHTTADCSLIAYFIKLQIFLETNRMLKMLKFTRAKILTEILGLGKNAFKENKCNRLIKLRSFNCSFFLLSSKVYMSTVLYVFCIFGYILYMKITPNKQRGLGPYINNFLSLYKDP